MPVLSDAAGGVEGRSMVEGARVGRVANPLVMNRLIRRWGPSTTTLRVAVPLPVTGRIHA
jgi:hypothetical protein